MSIIILGVLLFGVATVWFFFWRTNQIDRILSHKNKQIFVLLFIIFIVLAVLVAIENVISGNVDKTKAWSHLYGLFSQTVGAYSNNPKIRNYHPIHD